MTYTGSCFCGKDTFVITSGNMTEHHSAPGVTRGLCSKCAMGGS